MASGTLSELRNRARVPVRIRLRTRDGQASDIANQLSGAEISRINGQIVEFVCAPEDKMVLVRRVSELGVAIEDMEIDLPTLDQLYSHYRNDGDLQ